MHDSVRDVRVRTTSPAGARRRSASRLRGRAVGRQCPGSPADPKLWGPEAEPEAAVRLGWVTPSAPSRALLGELAHSWSEPRRGPGPRRPGRHGRLLAGPRGHRRHRRRAADRARHHRPRPGAGARWRTGSTRPSWSSPASPAAPSRPTASGGSTRRRSPTPGIDPAGTDRRRHRPRFAAGAERPRGRLPGGPGRPGRGRPLQRADRVRPGAQRAGGRRRRAGCSTRPRCSPRLSARRRDNPGLDLGAALGAAAAAGRDKLGSSRTARARGLADWAEQLIAESTGKARHRHAAGRRGRRRPRAPPAARRTDRRPRRRLGRPGYPSPGVAPTCPSRPAGRAVAGVGVRHRGRRPGARHQPVRPAGRGRAPRSHTARCSTAAGLPVRHPLLVDGPVEVHGARGWLAAPSTWPTCWPALLGGSIRTATSR